MERHGLIVYEGRGLAITLFKGGYQGMFLHHTYKISSPKGLMGGAGVFCHFQIIQHLADIASKLSHFLSDAAGACGLDERNGETSQSGDVLRPISRSYPAAIFVEIPVKDIMATVFDGPVSPVYGKDAFRICLLGVWLVIP